MKPLLKPEGSERLGSMSPSDREKVIEMLARKIAKMAPPLGNRRA